MGAEAQKTCTRRLAALGMTGESLPEPETMGFRLENAFAYTPYARVKDDGLPGLRTMEFRTPTIRPEERAEHYSLLSEQQRISTPRLRLKSTDLDKKDPGVDKAKERKIPSDTASLTGTARRRSCLSKHRARAVRSRKFRIWAGFSQPGPRSEELTGNAVLTQIAELP